jgi:hypothetical protein
MFNSSYRTSQYMVHRGALFAFCFCVCAMPAQADLGLGGLADSVGGAVSDAVGGAADTVGDAASGVGDAVGGAVSDVGGAVGGAVSDVGGAVGGPVGGAVGAVGSAVGSVTSGVGVALGGLPPAGSAPGVAPGQQPLRQATHFDANFLDPEIRARFTCAAGGNSTAFNGMTVVDRSGNPLGVVHDAIVDTRLRITRIRFLSNAAITQQAECVEYAHSRIRQNGNAVQVPMSQFDLARHAALN